MPIARQVPTSRVAACLCNPPIADGPFILTFRLDLRALEATHRRPAATHCNDSASPGVNTKPEKRRRYGGADAASTAGNRLPQYRELGVGGTGNPRPGCRSGTA